MGGIYIHIPYCKQACHYCDFHFSTNRKNEQEMIQAICREVELQAAYLKDTVETIYFGGGTPSLVSEEGLSSILRSIHDHFEVASDYELTLEANPDDLIASKLDALKGVGVNRLSIGIQTFNNEKLKQINRAHTKNEAIKSIQRAQSLGYDNLSIDLMYALPGESMEIWKSDLEIATQLGVPHISIYGLTIEDKTVFGHLSKKGLLQEVSEEIAADQYRYVINYLKDRGFDHYEVSNFGKPGYHSRHNHAYWKGQHYLGLGPGAHSYNGTSRQYNVKNNALYLKALESSHVPYKLETLSKEQVCDEYLLTSLRTASGIDLNQLAEEYGYELVEKKGTVVEQLKNKNLVSIKGNKLALTDEGFLMTDEITLMLLEEK